MKIVAIMLMMLATHTLAAQEVWGGKWNNRWVVFFGIDKTKGKVTVTYKWEENSGSPLRQSIGAATQKKNVITFGSITLKLDKETGVAYGKFKKPRTAKLIKLPSGTDIKTVTRKSLFKKKNNRWLSSFGVKLCATTK